MGENVWVKNLTHEPKDKQGLGTGSPFWGFCAGGKMAERRRAWKSGLGWRDECRRGWKRKKVCGVGFCPKSNFCLLRGWLNDTGVVREGQQDTRNMRGSTTADTHIAERDEQWRQSEVQELASEQIKSRHLKLSAKCRRGRTETRSEVCEWAFGTTKARVNAQSEGVVFISWVWGLFCNKEMKATDQRKLSQYAINHSKSCCPETDGIVSEASFQNKHLCNNARHAFSPLPFHRLHFKRGVLCVSIWEEDFMLYVMENWESSFEVNLEHPQLRAKLFQSLSCKSLFLSSVENIMKLTFTVHTQVWCFPTHSWFWFW